MLPESSGLELWKEEEFMKCLKDELWTLLNWCVHLCFFFSFEADGMETGECWMEVAVWLHAVDRCVSMVPFPVSVVLAYHGSVCVCVSALCRAGSTALLSGFTVQFWLPKTFLDSQWKMAVFFTTGSSIAENSTVTGCLLAMEPFQLRNWNVLLQIFCVEKKICADK